MKVKTLHDARNQLGNGPDILRLGHSGNVALNPRHGYHTFVWARLLCNGLQKNYCRTVVTDDHPRMSVLAAMSLGGTGWLRAIFTPVTARMRKELFHL